MHASVLKWVGETLTSEHVRGRQVIEVGSYNVNGSVRSIVEALEPVSYLGIDIEAGPGVDEVCELADADARFWPFGLVVCTEVLEHVIDWKASLPALVDLVAADGRLLITTRAHGFPYHPYPIDTWRYTIAALTDATQRLGLIVEQAESDPEAPGVFILARKPLRRVELMDYVHGVTPMTQNG